MGKKLSRLTSLLIAIVLISATVLSGCSGTGNGGTQNTKEPGETNADQESSLPHVKLEWLLRIPTQKDSDSVLAELNKTLKEKINATLNIQFIDAASYPEKTKLMISAGEEFDLMFTSMGFSYYEYVAMNAFRPLDDLLTKYAPKAYAQIPESFWDATKVKGKIYGFPNYQIVARQATVMTRKDMAEKYGFNLSEVTTLEDFEPILEKMKAGEPEDTFILSPGGLLGFDAMNYMGLEGLGAEGSPGAIEIDGTDYKVVNQFEHPAFIEVAKIYKRWADKGYINKDLALINDHTELYKTGKILANTFNTYKPGVEAETLSRYGFEPAIGILTDPYVSTASILGTMQAVSMTSKNPERAMMLLEIVNTDKEFYNTLAYGLEGRHYEKTGENSIKLIPESGYAPNVNWMLGNTLNAYLLPGVAADVPKQTDELNKSAKTSRIMGFTFDPEPVKTEIAQCLTISGGKQKYMMSLQFGMSDVDQLLEEMNRELRAAGMDKIIAEKQRQLDAWVAENKK